MTVEQCARELQQVEGIQHGLADGAATVQASKTATPSGPHTTASPSSVNVLARNSIAVTAIAG